jgi:allantoin racemase
MKTVGLIRVISGIPVAALKKHGALIHSVYPSLNIVTTTIEGFPDGIYNEELALKAVPAILSAAKSLSKQVDAFAVSCTEDPGVAELRRSYSRPVAGAGSSMAATCLALSEKIGVLTMTEHLPSPLKILLENSDFVWRHVPSVKSTLDLAASQGAILETATDLIDEGCAALALACTGFSTEGTAALLRQQLGKVVLDPVLAMGAFLSASL